MTTLILLFPVVDCGDPGNVNHATKRGSIYLYNNNVTYTCNTGYEMLGSANITCQASGFWSDNKPICTSKLHADFRLSLDNSNNYDQAHCILCMYVCIYVCMYICMDACIHPSQKPNACCIRFLSWMFACMHN